MNKIELYKEFRKELDEYAVPLILDNVGYIELIENNIKVGFICHYGDYVDAFYILPEYRKKGLGSKYIKKLYEIYKFKRLHIINNNKIALKFWKKNFELKKIESDFCDTLYEIERVKE